MDNPKKIAYDALLEDEKNLVSQIDKSILTQLAENRAILERLAAQLGETLPPLGLPFPVSNKDDQNSQLPAFSGKKVEISPVEFFNLAIVPATVSYLERTVNKAAPYEEILSALRQGGFQMKEGKVEEQKLRLRLLKSTNITFIKPNTFGIASVFEKGKRRGKGMKRGRKSKS